VAGHGRGPAAAARAIAGEMVSLSLPINRVSYSHCVIRALGFADPSVMIVSHKSGHYFCHHSLTVVSGRQVSSRSSIMVSSHFGKSALPDAAADHSRRNICD
jgi:hypothetical protein